MRPTIYFYYRKHLDRKLWVGLKTYAYLMCQRFGTTIERTQTGIYFNGEVDPEKSNEVARSYLDGSLPQRLLTRFKANLTFPKGEL